MTPSSEMALNKLIQLKHKHKLKSGILMKHQKTLYLLFTLMTAFSGHAVDGVIEINQTCATQLGCFSGDNSGFPIFINGNAGRSYRLTSDLLIPNKNVSVIHLRSNNITIDFNGFSIIRESCSNSECSVIVGIGSAIIEADNGEYSNVTIKNGSIIGMGGVGINLSRVNSVTVENMRIGYNGGIGILIQKNGNIKNSTVFNNSDSGIVARSNAYISGNIVYGNDNGIFSNSAIIQSNNVYSNNLDGILCHSTCNINNNQVYENLDDGIEIRSNALATTQGSLIKSNSLSGNGGFGIRFNNQRSAYQGNVITNNFSGTVTPLGFNLGGNYCTSNDVCP